MAGSELRTPEWISGAAPAVEESTRWEQTTRTSLAWWRCREARVVRFVLIRSDQRLCRWNFVFSTIRGEMTTDTFLLWRRLQV